MKLVRASWFVVLVVLAVTLVVPVLRQQLRIGLEELKPKNVRELGEYPPDIPGPLLKAYQHRALAFVEKTYPNDAEMLMAAGVLADNEQALKRAAETGKDPVAWAAYGEKLMQTVPAFERIGSSGVDPADAEAVKEEEERIAESGQPDRLTPEQADPYLAALRSWQEADPENALPVALEARLLYGLHRDQDACSVWAQAGRMPEVKSHAVERSRAFQQLLVAMGMPRPEAMVNADLSLMFPTMARLRDIARFAVYEGRLAAMRGDATTALTWWQSTADFGQHMEDSADTLIGMLVGIAIQGIGAAPAWRWVPDGVSGIPGGPLLGGRYFWGPQHSLYVEHMGEEHDQELRDRLVLGKLRSQASREYIKGGGSYEAYLYATRYLGFAGIAVGLALLLLVLYLAFGSWSRRAADEATNLRAAWQLILPLLTLAPAAVGSAIVLSRPLMAEDDPNGSVAALLAGLAGSVLLVLIIAPLAAIGSRAAGARFRTVWRGNLRRLLPVTIALCALIFLGTSAYAAQLRSQWAEKWSAPGVTEMTDMIRSLGDRWTHPTFPPDAWRAEYPPEQMQ
ncbi:MAG: hypothetical protein ACE149_03630 [Armatimonadota bacterium]